MKVLILHQHFKTPVSGGAIRSYYLAKSLVDSGIRTTVVTAHNGKHIRVENFEGIEVHYLPVSYDNSFSFFRRATSFLVFAFRSAAYSSRIKQIDLCYAISVPLTVGLAAIWIKKMRKIPFVFEVGDLWPDAPIEMGFINNYVFKKLLFAFERNIYKSAKAVIALSPPIKKAIEQKVNGIKVHLIPNMADTGFFNSHPKRPELEKKFNVAGKFVVSYIGAMGFANGLEYFIDCANACRKAELNIHFIVCGEGALKRQLIASANNLGLQNISFLDLQNRDGVGEVMNVTDAAFICYRPVRILETGSPNKFFDGLAAGKMMVVNFGGWIKKEVEENNCGIHVDPKHPTDFVKKIAEVIHDARRLEIYKSNSRKLAERKYSRGSLSKAFSDILKGLN